MSDELLLPHEEAKGERHLSERTAAVRHTRLDRLDNFFFALQFSSIQDYFL